MTEPNKAWAKSNPKVIETFVSAIPMGRPGDPDEIGPLAVYLASPASSYVTGRHFRHRWRLHALVTLRDSAAGSALADVGT